MEPWKKKIYFMLGFAYVIATLALFIAIVGFMQQGLSFIVLMMSLPIVFMSIILILVKLGKIVFTEKHGKFFLVALLASFKSENK